MAEFIPRRVPNLDARLRAIEDHLIAAGARVPEEVTAAPQQGVTTTVGTSTAGGSSSGGGGSSSFGYTASIPERKVIFDATGGHAHDGTDAHTIALAGDASGTNTAAVVDKLKGSALPAAPGVSQDKQTLRWNNGTPAYEFARFTQQTLLGAWTKADISTLGGADAEIDNSFSNAATKTIANPMPAAGAITTLSAILSGDVGAAGTSVTFTVYNNGVATLITGAVTGAAGTEDGFTTAFTPVTFAMGNRITVKAKITGAVGAVQAVVTVWGYTN